MRQLSEIILGTLTSYISMVPSFACLEEADIKMLFMSGLIILSVPIVGA